MGISIWDGVYSSKKKLWKHLSCALIQILDIVDFCYGFLNPYRETAPYRSNSPTIQYLPQLKLNLDSSNLLAQPIFSELQQG